MATIEAALADLQLLTNVDEVPPAKQSHYRKPAPTQSEIESKLKADFLTPSKELPWNLLDILQSRDLSSLSASTTPEDHFLNKFIALPPSISKTSIKFQRKGIAGAVSGYAEVYDKAKNTETASSSLSMQRKFAGGKGAMVQGESKDLPFQPGGVTQVSINDGERSLVKDERGFYSVAPGLSRGMRLDSGTDDPLSLSMSLIEIDGNDGTADRVTTLDKNDLRKELVVAVDEDGDDGLDIPDLPTQLTSKPVVKQKKNWAHMVDLDHKIENFEELVPNMARVWPFELDTFQKEAVFHLEQGDSVFVAAHTSAGKTVVAEYAIAMANRNMTKCIYTSPIKALSNQKFRDFKNEGQDVGLITGDVQINPESNCLIMTTEILRSMLYRGADLIRDVEFVVFDEVHYVNDIDRGVVWEEVIIMLPDHIKFILLSATVPNTFEFANWIGRTKQKDIYVISTPKRPVPLEIFVWAKNDLFKVIDAQRKFQQVEYKKHCDVLEKSKDQSKSQGQAQSQRGGGRGGRGGGRGGGTRGSNARGGRGAAVGTGPPRAGQQRFFQRDSPNKSTWIHLVKYLDKHKLLPMVTFVFSKKRCEEYCDTLTTIDFTTHKEKSEIHMFITKSVSILKKEDRELPQILKVREMLLRGIAVHHGGLLPIVKECIEILFSRGLVKVLFATETFAMGLNLPTRTVVFSELRKHDGRGFRNLLPGEFTQMAGRAGRRGLDTTGTVIVMSYNQPIQQESLKEVALGVPTKLQSQFRLTYNMILNLLRIEALRVEEMIKRSFSENSTQSLLPEHEKSIIALEKSLASTVIGACERCKDDDLKLTFTKLMDYKKAYNKIVELSLELPIARSIYRTGRLVVFRDLLNNVRPGFIVKMETVKKKIVVLAFETEGTVLSTKDIPYICTVPGFTKRFFPKLKFDKSQPLSFVEIGFESLEFVTSYCTDVRINAILNSDPEALDKLFDEINVLLRFQFKWREYRFDKNPTLQMHEFLQVKEAVKSYLEDNEIIACPDFTKHFEQLNSRHKIQEQITSLKSLVSDENLDLLPDYEQRLSVLKELGFVDENLNVVLKGRVACEINSGWELGLTELILNNFLSDFTSEEIIALLSVFVYEGKTNDEEDIAITPRLEKGKEKIKEIMSTLLEVYNRNQVPLTQEEEEFLERKRFNLMNVVYEWSRGMTFNEIMNISSEAEGTIVRVITRLDEICREVKNAALIIGDNSLHAKMSEAQEKIKRDIVFCASLYL